MHSGELYVLSTYSFHHCVQITLFRVKYLLTIISKMLKHLENDVMTAYNISCATEMTVFRSSLSLLFCVKGAKFYISIFHVYTHNYICQMHYHLNNIDDMGIEDVESLKQVFSKSNT